MLAMATLIYTILVICLFFSNAAAQLFCLTVCLSDILTKDFLGSYIR